MAGLGLALKTVREDNIDTYFSVNDVGSNAMAIAPKRMEDNKGYLLINSHQPNEGRFAWYEAHVHSNEGWEMIGGIFPGGISIFVGSNPNLGWAHTFNYHNFGDIYLLEINPENKNQYKYDNEWRNFEKDKTRLVVKLLGIPIPIGKKLFNSAYGPVFKTKHGVYAFRFPGYTDIRAAEQWFKMNKAKNLEEFEAALKMRAVPLFNTIYSDKEGNILYHSGGKIPVRDTSLNWSYPITSNSSKHKWTEILPYKAMPTIINPSCGYVFNCNNTPLIASGGTCNWDGDFIGLQRFNYNRGQQFDIMLKNRNGKFTEAFLDSVKFNTGYTKNGIYSTKFKALLNLDESKYPEIADAIKKLKTWDLQGGVDNKDAALVMVAHDFLRQKLNVTFGFLMVREENISDEDAVWAIKKAKKFLIRKHGSIDVPLGEVQRIIKGDKSFPADGLREVPRAMDTKLYKKRKGIFKVVGGDGYIQVVRFSKDNVEIKSINIYGASSNEKSPHYNDQMELFVKRQYKSMTFDKQQLLKEAKSVYHPGE